MANYAAKGRKGEQEQTGNSNECCRIMVLVPPTYIHVIMCRKPFQHPPNCYILRGQQENIHLQ